jgi:hypothetical protein
VLTVRTEPTADASLAATSQLGISFRCASSGTSQGGVEADGQRPVLADGELISVPAITLDAFIATSSPPPHLIKIDLEGGEGEVLRGAANLLRTHRPALILEVHHQQADEQIRSLLADLRYATDWHIPKDFPRTVTACPPTATRESLGRPRKLRDKARSRHASHLNGGSAPFRSAN